MDYLITVRSEAQNCGSLPKIAFGEKLKFKAARLHLGIEPIRLINQGHLWDTTLNKFKNMIM